MYLCIGVSILCLSTMIVIFDFGIVLFVCLRHVSCVPNVASFSGITPSVFSNVYSDSVVFFVFHIFAIKESPVRTRSISC